MKLRHLFLLILTLALTVSRAHAATFTVDRTDDEATAITCDDATPNDCSLRGAITKANGLSEASVINVPAGTYVLSQASSCTYTRRDFPFPTTTSQIPLCLSGQVTLQGAGADTTVIDGNQLGRVFFTSATAIADVRGVTIRNGISDRTFGTNPHGGGIRNEGTLTLTDVVVSNNSLDPVATGATGAGIYNVGGATLTLLRSTVTNNAAPIHTGGGGISTSRHGTLTVSHSVISNNTIGQNGGGIFNDGSTITITNSTISGNTVIFGLGGGIYNAGSSIVDITGTDLATGALTMVNSTVSGNTSGSSGGGIYDHFHSTIHLNNVTITKNTGTASASSGGVGGGLTTSTGGGVFLRNTIIAGNSAARGGQDCDARNLPGSIPLTSQGYNLIQNTTNCVLVGDTTGNLTGQDPQLGLLLNNGGSTPTHALAADSPAVDAGNPDAPGSGGTACAVSDQRGLLRPRGPRCDIGAFERTGALSLSGVLPAKGGNTGSVSALVSGDGFVDGATVRLTRAGQADIAGNPAQVDIGGSAIAATFNLAGSALGPWDVVVSNPDGTSKTLAGGFVVEAGRAPDLWVDVSGLLLRPGRPSRFTIIYGNRGNVDALAVPLSISTPGSYGLSTAFAITPPPPQANQVPTNWNHIPVTAQADAQESFVNVPLVLPVVPAGFTGRLQIIVTATPTSVASEIFVSIGSPHFNPTLDPQLVSSLVEGAQAYMQQNYAITIPPTLVPDLEQYVRNQLQLVVNNGRNALLASLGAAPQVYSFSQLRLDVALFGAHRALTDGQTSAPPQAAHTWLATAYDLFATLFSRLGPAEAHAQKNDCGKNLLPGQSGCKEGTDVKPPPPLAGPPDCDPVEVKQKLSGPLGTAEFLLNPPDCRITPEQCQALAPVYTLIRYADGTATCVETNCGKTFTRSNGETATDKCKRLPVNPINSADPNDKAGPPGVTAAHAVVDRSPFGYTINFENLETATAPAQVATITDQLDGTKMDLDTFSLGPISFGDITVPLAPGLQQFTGGVDLRPEQNIQVLIETGLDRNTGIVTWRFTSIDPYTGQLTEDPDAGFLPPNINPPEGNGSVAFTVDPKPGLATGAQICNQASIVFDVNAPIVTPLWCNSIDRTLPISQVAALSASQSDPTFPVQWSGSDQGTGIADYTIFVSENGGPFVPFVSETEETSTMFTGQTGKTYAFYSTARDAVGNEETPPATPDAVTTIGGLDQCPDDPNKTEPGTCGCGTPDTDSDSDGAADCNDQCPADPAKVAPGVCGCGVAETDSDGDGTADCQDSCPTDPGKTQPGLCGCGQAETADCGGDRDGDGTPDGSDGCPDDANKTVPSVCGCGVADTDSDGDGTPDCIDGCVSDPIKTAPGACGCGVLETDTDGDGTPDCLDVCPNDPQNDNDEDRICGNSDNCPDVANPDQADADGNGIGDVCDDVGFRFGGFVQPVDNPPTLNIVKAGRAVPVKFSLNGDQGLDIFAAGYPQSQAIDCDSTIPRGESEETVTAGSSSLEYDASTDQYSYVWKTNRAWAQTCRQFILRLDDGSVHAANFKFTK